MSYHLHHVALVAETRAMHMFKTVSCLACVCERLSLRPGGAAEHGLEK